MEQRTPPPPKKNGHDIDWNAVVKELNNNHGKFFCIGEFSPAVAHHIRTGNYPAFYPKDTANPEQHVRAHYTVTTRSITGSDPRRVELFICRGTPTK